MSKILTIGLAVLAAISFCSNGRGGLFSEYEVKEVTHRVSRGETIWGIAEQYYHLEQKEQLNEFVWRVDRQNGKKRFIQPGEIVLVKYHIVKE